MKNLDDLLESMIGDSDEKVPGLGLIVFKEGCEVYSRFLGRRHINEDKPVTRHSRFRAASVSKMFTILTIMQLVEQGIICLDSDVSDYLDFNLRNPNFPDTPITVRMLACHTSSIRDDLIYSLPPNRPIEDFFAANDSPHFAPYNQKIGSFFNYSNLNYGILGTVIERVTGVRFDLYQKSHIFQQLNFNADYLVGNLNKTAFDNLGSIYKKNNGKWSAQIDDYPTQPAKDMVLVQNPYARDSDAMYNLNNYKIGSNATIFSPAGGLRISFEELARCLEMIMNGGVFNGKQIIKFESLNEMMTPQWIYNGKNGDTYGVMFNYGLGMYKIDGAGKARFCKDFQIDFIGHSGEAYGLISGLYFIPHNKSGLLFMINGLPFETTSPKALGTFSNNFIWEEFLLNILCKSFFAD